jgi:3-oxoadipate enol-lactonase
MASMPRKRQVFLMALLLLSGGYQITHGQDRTADSKPAGHYLDLDGGRIYYEECGAGPSIVLLHDGLVHCWDGEWKPLCAKFHVIRYDRRGYGRSALPTAAFDPRADLAALLKHLNTARATLVGCSSGSALAIDFAITHPEIVERLVLIGAVVHGMPTSSHFSERGKKNSAPIEKGDLRAGAENWSKDRYLIADGHDTARKTLYDVLVQNPQNLKYTGKWEQSTPVSAISRLDEIHIPVLILVGEYDIPDVHAHSGVIHAGIWGSRRETLKDCGHLILLEKPEELTTKITNFVEKYQVVNVPANALASYTGRYKVNMNGEGEILVHDGRLMLHLPAEKDLPLFPVSESKFLLLVVDVELQFVKDANGMVTGLDTNQDGKVSHCPRI